MSLVVDASLTLAWVFERGVLTQARSTDFLARLGALPIRTDPASPLETTERITSLGRSVQLSSYDASYLELALRLGTGLASFDRALLAAAAAAGVAVYD